VPVPRRAAPEPLETADVAVITVGTVLWAVGLLLTLVLHDRLADDGHRDWVWIMAAGLFLGLIGVRHVRRRRTAVRTDRSG
jgi:uncharacterized protein DUF2530